MVKERAFRRPTVAGFFHHQLAMQPVP